MLTKPGWIAAGLAILVAVSAVMVVHGKFRSRLLFNEVQRLKMELDALEVEWKQLLLEEHAFADPARIESLAKSRLQMVVPKTDDIVYLPLSRRGN